MIAKLRQFMQQSLTIPEGRARAEIGATDTSFVPAEMFHRFVNIGDGPLKILWFCAAAEVTRTFTETGRTVAYLSQGDTV